MTQKRITRKQQAELCEWAISVIKANANQPIAIQALRLQALYLTHRQAQAQHRRQAEALYAAWSYYVTFRGTQPTPKITKDITP
jgi:hypothetical protein